MLDVVTHTSILKQNPLLANCREFVNFSLANNKIEKRQFKKNDYIIQQNTPYVGVHVVVQGLAKISKEIHPDNSNSIIRYVIPGDIIGVSSYVYKNDYTFSAVALENCETIFFPADCFQQMLSSKPDAALELMKVLCYNIHCVQSRTNGLFFKNVRQRVIELLISLHTVNSHSSKGTKLCYAIKDIAGLAGTTPNYLYKIITDLSQNQLISMKKKQITILDLQALKNYSNEMC